MQIGRNGVRQLEFRGWSDKTSYVFLQGRVFVDSFPAWYYRMNQETFSPHTAYHTLPGILGNVQSSNSPLRSGYVSPFVVSRIAQTKTKCRYE